MLRLAVGDPVVPFEQRYLVVCRACDLRNLHSSKAEGTAVEARIASALSMHMGHSFVGFFYCNHRKY